MGTATAWDGSEGPGKYKGEEQNPQGMAKNKMVDYVMVVYPVD